MSVFNDRKVISWAMYDWANSAFAVTVISAFFPLFLQQYWGGVHDNSETTFYLGAANSLASLVIVVLAPILGSIADRGARKKVPDVLCCNGHCHDRRPLIRRTR